jgi:uncharacterized protein YdiU (UPF0061 family)
MTFAFDNSYARLPERFFARQAPVPVAQPRLIKLNEALAEQLGLDTAVLGSPEGLAMLAGNQVPAGADPLAMAYAGHQFGGFVPRLGDGRALLLGEILDPNGERFDIQLKGSGRTPFSRGGDGRAWVGPVLREYILSEAMQALGIPTTRSLAAVATGEPVLREAGPLPGAVLTRVARGHVRVGTFEYFQARQDTDSLRQLADYVMARHYPEALASDQPYRALLVAVVARQAELVARWLGVGFIHGVMNTDNMSIAGETIDYGPCAFMDAYHPGQVYSSIDHGGRYAYGNQPQIAQWNLARLAQALLPLLDPDQDQAVAQAQAVIDGFGPCFEQAYLVCFRAKLGLLEARGGRRRSDRRALAGDGRDRRRLHQQLPRSLRRRHGRGGAAPGATRRWCPRHGLARALAGTPGARSHDPGGAGGRHAPRQSRGHPQKPPGRGRPRCGGRGRSEPLDTLLQALARPWDEDPAFAEYRRPPAPHQIVQQTFCGT